MKIVHLNTTDIKGGAARAAYRLHQGLLDIGQDSHMLVKEKLADAPTVHTVDEYCSLSPLVVDQTRKHKAEVDHKLSAFHFGLIQQHYIHQNRTDISNTLFSLGYPGEDLTNLELIQSADVINLHWLDYFQSPITLRKLLDLGKPVVWTLHDMWPFTGGCHYSAGCSRYQATCHNCPQLQDDPHDLTAALLAEKIELFSAPNLTIVTPSRWLADCVQSSAVFKQHPVQVIPNSLDTSVFRPHDKVQAKHRLGIDPDVFTILVGAENFNEKRKGFSLLLEVLDHCLQNSQFQELVNTKQIRLLCFGYPSDDLANLSIPTYSVGQIDSDHQLSQVYSAADIFVLPSLEDNLPNTMLEAMSCGVPVIGFAIGGLPDLVFKGETGFLNPSFDTVEMAKVLVRCATQPRQNSSLQKTCRQWMVENYKISIQAQKYQILYQNCIEANSTWNQSSESSFQLQSEASNGVEDGNVRQGVFQHILIKILTQNLEISQNTLKEIQDKNKILRNRLKSLRQKTKEQSEVQEVLAQNLQLCENELSEIKSSKLWKLNSLFRR